MHILTYIPASYTFLLCISYLQRKFHSYTHTYAEAQIDTNICVICSILYLSIDMFYLIFFSITKKSRILPFLANTYTYFYKTILLSK